MNDVKLTDIKYPDIELVRKWRNSPEVRSFMYDEKQISFEQQKLWFERINKEENSVYWIIEFQDKKIGLVSLTGINHTLKSCYWAFYIGDTSVRGAGIGAKVEYNILEYVFSNISLNKLRCEVISSNEKVIKMHEKFGFRRESYYREHVIKQNVKHDVIGLAILKSEWEILSPKMKEKIYGK